MNIMDFYKMNNFLNQYFGFSLPASKIVVHLAEVQALTGARPSWALLYFNFSKDIKDHKTQDTQTTILPISAIFLVLKVFSCSVLLFCLLLCVTFYRIDTKNDTKITNRLRVVSRAPCLDECFSISFFFIHS